MKNVKILISKRDINKKVLSLAKKINKDFKNKDLIIISVLTGSVVFCCDIIRNLNIDFCLDFIRVSSYNGRNSTNKIKLISSENFNIENKDVLIIEDICDTGQTLAYIKDLLLKKKAKTVKICALINKNVKKVKYVDIDYTGFNVDNKFIVGYGLDYNDKYRGLPYIGILK
jgi:hypoxanthine phosphoribosyltransferase